MQLTLPELKREFLLENNQMVRVIPSGAFCKCMGLWLRYNLFFILFSLFSEFGERFEPFLSSIKPSSVMTCLNLMRPGAFNQNKVCVV